MSSRVLAMLTLTAMVLLGAVSYGCAQKRSAISSTLPSTLAKEPILFGEQQSIAIVPGAATIVSDDIDNEETQSTLVEPDSLLDGLTQSADADIFDPRIVRADIRHLLQNKFPNSQQYQTAMTGAAILQAYLNAPQQNASALLKKFDCATISLTQADQNLIKTLTFDTPERRQLLKTALQGYQPPVSSQIDIDAAGNAISPCQG